MLGNENDRFTGLATQTQAPRASESCEFQRNWGTRSVPESQHSPRNADAEVGERRSHTNRPSCRRHKRPRRARRSQIAKDVRKCLVAIHCFVAPAWVIGRHRRRFRGALIRDLAQWTGCRVATLVWKAYAFLAPGGRDYDPKRSLSPQLGQQFGCYTPLTYLASTAQPGATRALDRILTETALNNSEWVRIAKVRVAEALFLELLLQDARALQGQPP